ncbi:MAG TPA: ketoacyl-ACP synthase III [Blastocatellia bacterium]|nr:ketoacyl-ACP synthase III [Blastocatellia bacterium]
MSCYVIGYGAGVPERVVTNEELGPTLGVAPEWIEANSGIRERRWASADQAASDLARVALQAALEDAGLTAEQIDYFVGCTLSPDYQVPGIAPIVQRKLESARQVPAVDLRVGCAAILYSLQLARALICSRTASAVACFGAEAQSKGLDLDRRSAEVSMLFGDGAGAIVVADESLLRKGDARPVLRIDDVWIATDGSFAEELIIRSPGTANGARWVDREQIDAGLHLGSMQGRSVILHAVRKLADAARLITERNGISIEEIDLIVPHQANANLLRSLANRLSIASERVITNVDRYGNTSGASAFLALCQAARDGRLRPGARVLILAFGAGFTWGAAVGRVLSPQR